MGKVITGSHARINELIKGIPDDELISLVSSADGKLSVLIKTNGLIGEPISDDEKEKYEAHITQLNEALASTKGEAESLLDAKEVEINALKVQVGNFTKENAKLNKELEKCKTQSAKEIEKLKKAIDALGM